MHKLYRMKYQEYKKLLLRTSSYQVYMMLCITDLLALQSFSYSGLDFKRVIEILIQ